MKSWLIWNARLRRFLWKTFFENTQDLCRRADVHQQIDASIYEHRDKPGIVRILQDLQTRI